MKLPFSLWSYCLWALNAGLELVILVTATRRRTLRGVTALPLLLAVTLATDVVCFAVPARWYWRTYWTSIGLEQLLSAALAVQILSQVLRCHLRAIHTAASYFSLWLCWLIWTLARGNTLRGMLGAISAGYFIAVVLVGVALIIPSDEWSASHSAIALGLFVNAAASVALSIIQQRYGTEHLETLRLIWQVLPIPTLMLWWSAAHVRDDVTGSANG